MNIKHTLKNLPRAPSSDSVVVSDIKNIIANTVCFMETTMADKRFMLIMVGKDGRIYALAMNESTRPFYFFQSVIERAGLMLHPCASR